MADLKCAATSVTPDNSWKTTKFQLPVSSNMAFSSSTFLTVALLLFVLATSSEGLSDTATAVRQQETIFLSRCFGRGRAVRLCRKKRNGFCRAVRCMKENGNRGFSCRCRALPSPSPIAVAPNRRCTPGKSKCTDGYTCSCGGRCKRKVTLKIKAVGDDALKIYTCGKKIGSTPSFDKLAQITYEGACDNIIIEATNQVRLSGKVNPVALSVLVQMGGKMYGTKSETEGVMPLYAVGTFDPESGFEFNKGSFDYSGWTPVVVVDFLTMSKFKNIAMLESLGARPVCTSTGTAAPGTYGFRINAPYC